MNAGGGGGGAARLADNPAALPSPSCLRFCMAGSLSCAGLELLLQRFRREAAGRELSGAEPDFGRDAGRLKLCAMDEAGREDEKTAESLAESGAVSFTEEDHLEKASRQTAALYRMLKERVLAFGAGAAVEPRKLYVSFTAGGKVFLAAVLQRSQLKIFLNMKSGTLEDPAGLAEDMTGRGHWGAGDYQICLAGEEELEAALPLIQQAFEAVKA